MTIQKTKTRTTTQKSSVSKTKKNQYFRQEHEDAIIEYISCNDIRRKSYLYVTFIGPAFDEMVDKIIYTYKFTSLPNILCLKEECKVWLMTILDKFEVKKGYKAFSYFSVITKNWFIHKVKKVTKQHQREVQLYDISKDIEQRCLSINNDYIELREKREYWEALGEELEDWLNYESLKDSEKKVLDAIQILFNNIEDIEIFNKKAFYLYIRELTSLSTKQIVNSLNRIRERYHSFRNCWDAGEI